MRRLEGAEGTLAVRAARVRVSMARAVGTQGGPANPRLERGERQEGRGGEHVRRRSSG